jgi:FkbM family methyltransferase
VSLFDEAMAPARAAAAADFCRRFLAGGMPRYVLGTNSHAASIATHVDIDGFIDDFSGASAFCQKPVLRTDQVPPSALVVSAVLGKVWTAQRRLAAAGLENLDYYAFRQQSQLPIDNPFFWDDFRQVFHDSDGAFERLHAALADDVSRDTLRRIVNFRLTADIDWMQGFTDRQDRQYFEDFLQMRGGGETFVDIGGFDGFTSQEFIKRCPGYACVHLFEPEPGNMAQARARLAGYRDIYFHAMGVSDCAQTLRLSREGSMSRLSNTGDVEIALDRLDAVIDGPVTFIKMDIEGAERPAIDGAASLIRCHVPRLALAAYHRADDFYRIPEKILALHSGYDIYLRHYTECRDETVMFFIPRDGRP